MSVGAQVVTISLPHAAAPGRQGVPNRSPDSAPWSWSCGLRNIYIYIIEEHISSNITI